MCPIGRINPPPLPQYCEFEVSLNGSSFTLWYKLTGRINDAALDASSKRLTVNYTDDGSSGIQLLLSRQLIDARSSKMDANFTIMIDGQYASYTESSSSTTRELLIPTTHGNHIVQVLGTAIAPELPSMIFLTLSVVTILALFAIRNRLANFGLSPQQ